MLNKLKQYYSLIIYSLLVIVLIVIDLVSKAVMESVLKVPGESITLIPNLFEFQLVYNRGAFSGMLGSNAGHIVLIIISSIGAILLPFALYKYRNTWSKGMLIGVALAAAGDIGNLVDRFIYLDGEPRGVIDFLHFYIPALNFNWPTFNFADMCLVVGVIVFIIFYLIYDKKMENEKLLAQQKVIEETKKRLEEEKKAESTLDSNVEESNGESDGK